jgi:hypothetical protein
VFGGFAVLRGAELAATENDSFGIDHPTVGALWTETIGFPQTVADAIRKAVLPAADGDLPLDAALRGACVLATAAAQKSALDSAWAALPAAVQARFGGAGPDAAFVRLYEAVQEIEPTF